MFTVLVNKREKNKLVGIAGGHFAAGLSNHAGKRTRDNFCSDGNGQGGRDGAGGDGREIRRSVARGDGVEFVGDRGTE